MANKILKVKKVKTDGEGAKRYYEVGTLILRPTGNGTLFLNFLDGDYAVFPKIEAEEAGGGESAEE